MNIKEIVSLIFAGIGDPADSTFRIGWKSFQNFKADNESVFPLRYLDTPITGDDSLKQSGYIETDFTLTIAFLDKTTEGLTSTPVQADDVIQEQRRQSSIFITACQNSDFIHFVKGSKRTEIVNIFDMSLSGIILEITLTPFNPDDKGC